MSFPNIVYGKPGQEKTSHSTGVYSLGQKMVFEDGREFVYAHCSSTAALSIGELTVQKAVSSTGHVVSLTGSAAIGATTIAVTLSATGAVTKDQFKDGWIGNFASGTAGWLYKIKSHASGAVSSTVNFILYPYDPVIRTLAAATSKVMIRENEFKGTLVRAAATSQPGINVGVPANTVAADYYYWAQRVGPAMVLVAGTVGLVGEPATAATTVAGGFQRFLTGADTTTVPANWSLGRWLVAPAASTDYGMVYLDIR